GGKQHGPRPGLARRRLGRRVARGRCPLADRPALDPRPGGLDRGRVVAGVDEGLRQGLPGVAIAVLGQVRVELVHGFLHETVAPGEPMGTGTTPRETGAGATRRGAGGGSGTRHAPRRAWRTK